MPKRTAKALPRGYRNAALLGLVPVGEDKSAHDRRLPRGTQFGYGEIP